MKILIINGGSSSFKYQLIEMDTESVLAKGLAERIGLEQGKITHEYWKNGEKYKVSKEMHFDNHEVAFKEMAAYLTDNEVGVIKSINEVKYIGHRGVHGGKYTTPKRVTPEVMEELRKGIPLALKKLRSLLFLILPSTRPCLREPIVMLSLTIIILRIEFVYMVFMVLAISM